MVWGPTSRASAKSTKLFDRLKPMNSYRVISQLTYEKEKNQFWELFKNGQCPLATPSQPTVGWGARNSLGNCQTLLDRIHHSANLVYSFQTLH